MIRAVFVRPARNQYWRSCQVISGNLEKAYVSALGPGEGDSIAHSESDSDFKIFLRARRILERRCTHLVFFDRQPPPVRFLSALREIASPSELPAMIFHVYGDFCARDLRIWRAHAPLLKGIRARWVCSSSASLTWLARSGLPADRLAKIPFPVSPEAFFFDSGLRERLRQELGAKPKEFVILYTGRISPEKNLVPMVEQLSEFLARERIPFRLVLVGNYENSLAFLASSTGLPVNSVFLGSQNRLRPGPRGKLGHLVHLPERSSESLRALYCAADLFCSWSTSPSEVFGMAAAEALCCGLPALLTAWGGFRDFAIDESSVALCPVFPGQGVALAAEGLEASWVRESYRRGWEGPRRESRAALFAETFGLGAVSRQLARLLDSPNEAANRRNPAKEPYSDVAIQ